MEAELRLTVFPVILQGRDGQPARGVYMKMSLKCLQDGSQVKGLGGRALRARIS